MPIWASIILGSISLISEVVKYMRQQHKCRRTRSDKIWAMRDGVRKARTHDDTSDMEKAFRGANLVRNPPDSDQRM